MTKPGGIKITKAAIYKRYEAKGLDADELAIEHIKAWAAKVPVGTQMIVAKMKCALADGPCGCGEDTPVFKCTGPYPPVPHEIIRDWILSGLIPGIEGELLPAPEAIIVDGHVHVVEFVGPYSPLVGGPATSLYIKKTA